MREKVANKVLFDSETYENRLLTEIPKVRGRIGEEEDRLDSIVVSRFCGRFWPNH
jgi:hypothetical protein